MENRTQDVAYQEPYSYEPAPKKRMSGWLIAILVILALVVVCCLCACVVILLSGPAMGTTFSTIIEDLLTMTPMP